ncbi:hypothetical protein ETAA8_55210 [Anatilimnocola aggregata]|uniref:Uncharacterized protein n=1 Tax=Anatilimnocola aggregata TaxID=2528021 RepID=A0A517YJK2_9BACT|nr:hypothetical protein [Anatilimnocola aggregata]QDU30392.1 hypothetical protein ETAA8_55210 [Anatilimnocola aggregata]
MKAPKISLDTAKLQQILLLHVEKIVLGIVLLAVIWFVYQGASLTSLDNAKTPHDLINVSNEVTTEINNPAHAPVIVKIEGQDVVGHPVQLLVRQGQQPNDAGPYRPTIPLKTPDYPKASQRIDPRIFPALKVKVVPLHGPLAYLGRMGEIDPILATEVPAAGDDPQGRQPKVNKLAPKTKRPNNKRGGELLEGEMQEGIPAGFGEGEMGMNNRGLSVLPPEAKVGFHPSGEVAIREARAVVVLAAVPLEKQLEEFEAAFKDALDYDPARDIPRYILFHVERADVTDDPAQDPAQAKWESLSFPKALTEMYSWAPSPHEVVNPNAVDPAILTNRVPPFMQREIYEALVHPDIPAAQLPAAGPGNGMEGNLPGVEGAMPVAPKISEEDLTGAGGGAPLPGMTGVGGEGRMPFQQQGMQPGFRPNGFGEGGPGAGGPMMTLTKYKLLRFTDTTVQPSRKYRYRVKLLVEDPNNPWSKEVPPRWDPTRTVPYRRPSIQSMSPNVLNRVRAKEAGPNSNLAFLLESDPSEPSDIVELPELTRYFAGKATSPSGNPVRPGTPPVFTTQPFANLLTVMWDANKAVDVPGEKEVFRGSILNFDKDVEVIHPAKLLVHPIGKYSFRTDSIVVDFTGGNEIPSVEGRRSDPRVQEPCEMLVFDGQGNLKLLDEADDVEGFRRYLPPKPEAPKTTGPAVFGPDAAVPGDDLLNTPRQPRNRRANAAP